jgi:hypothetical protein
MLSLIRAKFYESEALLELFLTNRKRRNDAGSEKRKKGKRRTEKEENRTKQNRIDESRKPKGQEHRKVNDFLTLPAKSMNLVEVVEDD